MNLLVGSTGFVGGNLLDSYKFDAACHSIDITEYYGSCPDLCVYAGVPAAMYLANADPDADLALMKAARTNIGNIRPEKLVLISSIAVYSDSRDKNEDSVTVENGLPAYGKNRLLLEKWVREDFPDALIVRLPALFGKGLKKNFLYDLHSITPFMLKPELYEELAKKSIFVKQGYSLAENGFYKLNEISDKANIKSFFEDNDFNALAFTDSRSKFQFYNLGRLWGDINTALENGIALLNISTPPVTAEKVYTAVTGKNNWKNFLDKEPFDYGMKTKYDHLFGGENGYFCSEEEEIRDICRFMNDWQ